MLAVWDRFRPSVTTQTDGDDWITVGSGPDTTVSPTGWSPDGAGNSNITATTTVIVTSTANKAMRRMKSRSGLAPRTRDGHGRRHDGVSSSSSSSSLSLAPALLDCGDFDTRISGLGQLGGPFRYEVRGGKAVPYGVAEQQLPSSKTLVTPASPDEDPAVTIQQLKRDYIQRQRERRPRLDDTNLRQQQQQQEAQAQAQTQEQEQELPQELVLRVRLAAAQIIRDGVENTRRAQQDEAAAATSLPLLSLPTATTTAATTSATATARLPKAVAHAASVSRRRGDPDPAVTTAVTPLCSKNQKTTATPAAGNSCNTTPAASSNSSAAHRPSNHGHALLHTHTRTRTHSHTHTHTHATAHLHLHAHALTHPSLNQKSSSSSLLTVSAPLEPPPRNPFRGTTHQTERWRPVSSVYSLDPTAHDDSTEPPQTHKPLVPDRSPDNSPSPPPSPSCSRCRHPCEHRRHHNTPSGASPGQVANVELPPRLAIPGRPGVPAFNVDDVSPPSSPEATSPRFGHRSVSPDISPVDTIPEASHFGLGDNNNRQNYPAPPSWIPRPAFTPKPHSPIQRQPSFQQTNPPAPSRHPLLSSQPSLPGMRSKARRNEQLPRQRPVISAPIPQATTKWDPYSGEPATTVTGKSGSVKPGEYPGFAQGLMRKIRQGGHKSSSSKATPLEERPEWKGGSGRSAIVNPIRDQAGVSPLCINPGPRPARLTSAGPLSAPLSPSPASPPQRIAPSLTFHGSSTTLSFPRTSPIAVSIPAIAPPPRAQTVPISASAYPSPPFATAPLREAISAVTPSAALSSHPFDPDRAIRRKQPPVGAAVYTPTAATSPTPTSTPALTAMASATLASNESPPFNPCHSPQPSYSSSVSSPQAASRSYGLEPPEIPQFVPVSPVLGLGPEQDWSRPAPDFTYDAVPVAVAAPDQTESRPASPEPNSEDGYVPISSAPPQIETPILDRKRPKIVREDDQPRSPTPEPIVISIHSSWKAQGMLREETRNDNDSSDDNMCDSVTEKALPLDPLEMESGGDRVAQLNARLRALANRRINITKSIHQMTELMPQDSLTASADVLRKREVEKKKVETLRNELAEIQREEYELGLKLHRAYKRMDRESECEPTSLWVRRATAA